MAFTNIGFDVFESERLLCEQEGREMDEMRGEDVLVGTFPTLAEAQAEDYKEDCYETVGMVLERSREIAGMKAGHSH